MKQLVAGDWELLRSYVEHGDEEAFAQLVSAHVDLVYSVALRQCRDRAMAEDVVQTVFLLLARKARTFNSCTILPAWLHQAARFTAINALRRETRRKRYERKAAEMTVNCLRVDASWERMSPVLDEGIGRLNERERAAVMLRYFENHSLAETGKALGISEEAAGMRLSRALRKLRTFFRDHRVSLTSTELGAVISVRAIHAAPGGLAHSAAQLAMQAMHGAMPAELGEIAHETARWMMLAKVKEFAAMVLLWTAVGIASCLLLGYGMHFLWRELNRPVPQLPDRGEKILERSGA